MPPLSAFVDGLLRDGRVRVRQLGTPVAPDDRCAALDTLVAFEADYALDLPLTPPRFDPLVALAAFELLRHGCRACVFRELPADDPGFAHPIPSAPPAERHYAVDLAMRFLGDLVALARGRAPTDPVLERFRTWARDWPLSSVGISGVDVDCPPAIAEHPCLARLYVDRIIATGDRGRLRDPRAQDLVRRALGEHAAELAPGLLGALTPPEPAAPDDGEER